MPNPKLIFITDVARFGQERTLTAAKALCEAGPPGSVSLQLRDKQLSGRQRLQLARELRDISRDAGQLFVVNDRMDLAVLSQADGVHLGEASLDPLVVRAGFPHLWISCAWHSGEPRVGADAYVLSPVVAPRKGVAALGVRGLEKTVAAFPGLSIYALGGVDAKSAALCLSAKAVGVAVCEAAYVNPVALLDALVHRM